MLFLSFAQPLAAQTGPGGDPFQLPSVQSATDTGAAQHVVPAADPYDRLRQRSATERWETLRREWLKDAPQVTYQPETGTPTAAPSRATTVPAAPSDRVEGGFRPTRTGHPQTADADDAALDPFVTPTVVVPTLPSPTLPSAAPVPSTAVPPRLAQDPFAPRAPATGPVAAPPAPVFAPATEPELPTAPAATQPTPVPVPADPPPAPTVPMVPAPTPIGPPAPQLGGPLDKSIRDISPFHDYLPQEQVGSFRPDGELPAERTTPRVSPTREQAPFPPSRFHWEPTDLFHNPLYFNDTLLERYGHSFPECVQPFVSVGLFSAQLMALPYQMAIDPVCEKRYAIGYDRPGDCVPYAIPQVPFNAKAAATTAGFYTGMIFLIP